MTKLQKEITKKAGCSVLDFSKTEIAEIKKDLTRRIAKQEKALVKSIEKGWSGISIIEDSIVDLKKTLEVVKAM